LISENANCAGSGSANNLLVFQDINDVYKYCQNQYDIQISKNTRKIKTEITYKNDNFLDIEISFNEIFIIGGASIYEIALERADKLYLSHVQTIIKGDTFFPKFNIENWQVIKTISYPAKKNDDFDFLLKMYERKK
jgi:dihydrofolate reductase